MLAIIEPRRSDVDFAAPPLLLDFLIFGMVGCDVVFCEAEIEADVLLTIDEISFCRIGSNSAGGGGGTSIGTSGGGGGGLMSHGGNGGVAMASSGGCNGCDGIAQVTIGLSFTIGSSGGAMTGDGGFVSTGAAATIVSFALVTS